MTPYAVRGLPVNPSLFEIIFRFAISLTPPPPSPMPNIMRPSYSPSTLLLLLLVALLSPFPGLALPSFVSSTLQHPNRTDYDIPFASALTAVPNNPAFFIVATVLGEIRLLRVRRRSSNIHIARTLSTANAGPGRSVLGIYSDPFHNKPGQSAFFISTSSLQWRDQGLPDSGWQNGKVELLILTHADNAISITKTIASGLPVSLSNWGVFGTFVDNAANLLISIGTFNNGGAPSDLDGNLPDCIASASFLKLDVRNPSITGKLEWSSDDPVTASLTTTPAVSGISIFATGIRAGYQPVYTTRGKILTISGGANAIGGPRSISCTQSKPFKASEPDNVFHVRQGKWYGHANRARGAFDPQQCVFVPSFFSSRRVARLFPGYTPPLFTGQQGLDDGIVGSGTVGVVEYTPAWFKSLRGQLIGTESDAVEDTVRVIAPGMLLYDLKKKRLDRLGETPGISAAIDIYGSILSAQVEFGKIGIAIPVVSKKMSARNAIRVVFPTRGVPGSRLFIFGTSTKGRKVRIGGFRCLNVKIVSLPGKVIRCKVPDASPKNRPLTVSVGSAKLRKAFTVLDPSLAE